MEHAWLDSLSEDWVSQPRSDDSVAQLPPMKDTTESSKRQSLEFPSRLPRRAMGARSSLPATNDSDNSVLIERSLNDVNGSVRRLPSKLSQELKVPLTTNHSRCASGASSGSVVHNTIQHQFQPQKSNGHTPEWKRRLVNGDMQYGEQRDLFCSAAAGLQDMFKPPAPDAPIERTYEDESQHEFTMASSPPVYSRRRSVDLAEEVDSFEQERPDTPDAVTPSPSPRRSQRDVQYKLNVEAASTINTPPSMMMKQRAGSSFDGEIYLDESCLSVAPGITDASRKASGQSDTKNEDFSEILIRKHSHESGKVEFAPIEVPADQLKAKLESLRINQMLLDSQVDPQQGFDGDEDGFETLENTDDYAQQGGFLNFHRGGRSAEGSFRHRGLSPGFGVESSMLPDESMQASTPKHFGTINTYTVNSFGNGDSLASPPIPLAPFPSPEKRQTRTDNAGGSSAGSPLKLFGPYDTFTNQTLLRRISQFEEGTLGSPSQQSLADVPGEASHPLEDEGFADLGPITARDLAEPAFADGSRSFGAFGAGDLEGYKFNADLSYAADDDSKLTDGDEENDEENDKENMSPKVPLPRPPFLDLPQCKSSPNEESEIVVRRRRNKSVSSNGSRNMRVCSISSVLRKSISKPLGAPEVFGTPKRDVDSESKRPRTSPSKDPTPKRRRTLHRTDIAYGRECVAGIDVAHQQIQSIVGKKRKDARPSGFELASPNILATRPILRPRTPSARFLRRQNQEELSSADRPRTAPIRGHRDENVPIFDAVPVETGRKPSIRTQDFVNQAAQIMAMIRNQVRPGLASVEESGAEYEASPFMSDSLGTESTTEPFSRPPSREGKPFVSRVPHRQEDPDLVDRLRKYQELSDMGDVISSSMRSMGLAKDAIREAQEVERHIEQHSRSWSLPVGADDDEVISDLPNVRISTNPAHNGQDGSPQQELLSDASSQSTSRSYPTASSRGSDTRRTIMPESVSHLIPDRVGSMWLDKNNNIWYKNKEIPVANVLPSDSDDDPFASIPDLSVDLTKELQNLKLTNSRKSSVAATIEKFEAITSPNSSINIQPKNGYMTFSPDQQLSPQVGVLARDEFRKLDLQSPMGSEPVRSDDDGPELDASAIKTGNAPAAARRRNITITFSSPVASFIEEMQPEDLDSMEDDQEPDHQGETPAKLLERAPEPTNVGKATVKNGGQGSVRGSIRKASRTLPARDPNFVPRPVSRIDEQDEDSTVELPHHDQQLSIIGETSIVSHKTDDNRRTSLSFILNRTPANNRVMSLRGDDNSMIGQNVGKLSLSPLSEFTLNNSDQSFGFEVSYVMGHRHMETGKGNKKVLSMTIRDLVDKLSEVEPFEPYWEDITELDLHGKRLGSLHMLDEFCSKIVTLDASNNALGHLDGVPCSVRQLKVSENMLTELTSWDHLKNLQYVDISGNEVKSLSALKGLVHLRSIRADNNELTSLDGLDCHDGLLSLRARDNRIEELDFASLKLDRLTELDLSDNTICSIYNLELLPSLARLKLSKNRLGQLTLKGSVKTLRQLDVSDNELASLDMTNLPNLQSLHADRNFISSMQGFSKARRLDSLSLREQQGEHPLDISFLSAAYEIRKLFLSGNYLGTFEPHVDFLNLQLLELANCGLQALPENLGQLMPNLRTLNINFNAVSDLSPLRFIPRLKKLLAAGNRLADSTMVTELLSDFPHLTRLDLRDNPVTLGFYAPIQVLVSAKDSGSIDPFTLPECEVERDETYAGRLDETTKLRRRLHQISFVASCKRLRTLDGLPLCRKSVLARDEILGTLIKEGLLPQLDEGTDAAEQTLAEPIS